MCTDCVCMCAYAYLLLGSDQRNTHKGEPEHSKSALPYLAVRRAVTALTFMVHTGRDFRWACCLISQTGTVQLSPVYSSFHHPFSTMASGKTKSTRGHAFGCLQHRGVVQQSAAGTSEPSDEVGRAGQVNHSGYPSHLKKGRILPVRYLPHSWWELSQAR